MWTYLPMITDTYRLRDSFYFVALSVYLIFFTSSEVSEEIIVLNEKPDLCDWNRIRNKVKKIKRNKDSNSILSANWLKSFFSDVNQLEEMKEMLWWWYKVLPGPKPAGSFRFLSRLTNWPNIWSLTFLCCLGGCTALTKKCKPKRPPESRRVERTSKVQFHLFLQTAVLHATDHLLIPGIFTVVENHRKSLINIASEASYVYILSEQKFIKNVKKRPFCQVFDNLKLVVK